MMKLIKPALFAVLLGAALFAQAADDNKANPVLKGAQVTESNLIDALSIAPPEAASGTTRGFKVAKTGQQSAPVKAGPGKASLLITFATGSTDLTEEAKGLLATLGKALQSDTLAGFSFKVEGHADARGDADANMRLSQGRAQAVVDYLSSQNGILQQLAKACLARVERGALPFGEAVEAGQVGGGVVVAEVEGGGAVAGGADHLAQLGVAEHGAAAAGLFLDQRSGTVERFALRGQRGELDHEHRGVAGQAVHLPVAVGHLGLQLIGREGGDLDGRCLLHDDGRHHGNRLGRGRLLRMMPPRERAAEHQRDEQGSAAQHGRGTQPWLGQGLINES